MPKSSVQILAEHAAATLPEASQERREVLGAILMTLKKNSPAYANVVAQLAAIDEREKLQAQLPLIFKRGTPNSGNGNGGAS